MPAPVHKLIASVSGVVEHRQAGRQDAREVVDIVKRLVRPAPDGACRHLDPLATGVLVVCVGAARGLIEYVQREPKRYRATSYLGRSSPTEDVEGEVTILPDPPRPGRAEISGRRGARLTGRDMQRPPILLGAAQVGGNVRTIWPGPGAMKGDSRRVRSRSMPSK